MKDSRARRIVKANRFTFFRWLVSLVGFAIAVWGVASSWDDWSLGRLLWVVVSAVLGIVFLVYSVREWLAKHSGPRGVQVTRRRWGYFGPYSSWQEIGLGRTHAVYSPQLNRRLAAGDPIQVDVGDRWEPEGRAGEHRKHQLQKLRLNEEKYRLASDLLADSPAVRLEVTDYAAFMVTNRLAYEAWWNPKTQDFDLTFDHVEPTVREEGKLPPLGNSNASNHIGGDLLAVGDGFAYLQQQGRTALMYPGRWVASASGSFDLDDLTPSGDLQDLVKTGLLRELTEEMKLPAGEVPGLDATKVIGYARATYLGGKPQFYGICRIGRVKPTGDEFTERFERIAFDVGASGLIAALDRFADEHADQLSPPLEVLIEVAKEWLSDDPHAERWLWPSLHAAVS